MVGAGVNELNLLLIKREQTLHVAGFRFSSSLQSIWEKSVLKQLVKGLFVFKIFINIYRREVGRQASGVLVLKIR